MAKPLPPVPVISQLDGPQSQLLRNYLDELATRGVDVAPAEAARLSPYLAALSDQLADDIAATAAQTEATADFTAADFASPQHLRQLFNKIARVSRNVILSELIVVPRDALSLDNREMLLGRDTRFFSGDVVHNGRGYTLGFIQVGKENGSVSAPVFAFDSEMMSRIRQYNPQVMLRAFQRVMTAGNHDMQHHYTNDILNPDIANTKKSDPMVSDLSVPSWHAAHFQGHFGGDTDPASYESWLMLNHASVRQRMDDGDAGVALRAQQTQFFDELARIVAEDQKINGDESAHALAGYFGMGMMFALSRYRGLDHPQMRDALARFEALDPMPDAARVAGGLDDTTPRLEGVSDYGHIRLQQMQTMAPWALKLMAPEAYDNADKFQQASARRGAVNAGMITSSASGARYFSADGTYHFSTPKGNATMSMLHGRHHSFDGAPAVRRVSADGKSISETWYEHGRKTRILEVSERGRTAEKIYTYDAMGGGYETVTTEKTIAGNMSQEWQRNGRRHREGAPAFIATYADGTYHERWAINGDAHRVDGPATIETSGDGMRRETWQLFGRNHREDGPAITEVYPDGERAEKWMRNGESHREDGPADILIRADGSGWQQWYIDGNLHRDGGPAFIDAYEDGRHTEVWYQQGQMNRVGGPARSGVDYEGTRYEEWFIKDKRHRVDGPAVVKVMADGARREEWWQYNEPGAPDGAANLVLSKPDGTRIETWQDQYRSAHNDHAPARITTYPDGRRLEEWLKHDRLNRDDGPARIMIHPDGTREETWFKNGRETVPLSERDGIKQAMKDMDAAKKELFGYSREHELKTFLDQSRRATEQFARDLSKR